MQALDAMKLLDTGNKDTHLLPHLQTAKIVYFLMQFYVFFIHFTLSLFFLSILYLQGNMRQSA